MNIWRNVVLGKDGWLFCALIVGIALPILIIAFYVQLVGEGGWQNWELFIIFAMGLFIVRIVILGIVGLAMATRSAKRIEITPDKIHITTFSGKRICFNSGQNLTLHERMFTKRHHYMLFPKARESLVIQGERYTVTISAYTEEFESLSRRLYQFLGDAAFSGALPGCANVRCCATKES